MSEGKILLVGFGPGAHEHMSLRAIEAIKEADVVIGYSTYIRLVKEFLDGKEVIRKGMTEEIDRCIEAYEQAQQGKIVALVSSGDIGIYGMAGPTYEVLLQAGWTPGGGIDVEVVPGSTALSACASLVGAPLTHDFCSISLSDLLTPWPVIARRLETAGRGDFVISLYNPKSGRRSGQIVEAQRILLQYRTPETPVAVVKSAYRKRQNIQMTTLDKMSECDIGMLTTVLIGNSSSFMQADLMITPRGYANKYQSITGETKEGEKAGHSLSMGLMGWKAVVRRYLRENNDQSMWDATQYFDAPFGEILAAMSEGEEKDAAGDYDAECLPPDQLEEIINAVREEGHSLCATFRGDGAICEFVLRSSELVHTDNGIKLENENTCLTIEQCRIHHIWRIKKANMLSGIVFLNVHDEFIFSLSPELR